jgi:hypothetical protein
MTAGLILNILKKLWTAKSIFLGGFSGVCKRRGCFFKNGHSPPLQFQIIMLSMILQFLK